MSTNQYISITKPEDYQLVYYTDQNGHIWLDAKNRPIPLTQILTGHINSTDPVLLWNSRVTREGYHSLPEGANQTQANLATPPFDPLANHSLLYNQSLVHNSLVNLIDKSLNMQTTMLKQTSASAKDHYISSAKTYDGKDCKEFSNWLESVYRMSRISGKDLIEVALVTSTGPLHKHISELMALGINWDVIKNKVQERFSEFGSPIVAQSKLSSFTQGTMTLYEYISEFTSLVEYAHRSKLVTLAAIC